MKFDKILNNNKLWAVRYENETDNVLRQLFSKWSDPEWLIRTRLLYHHRWCYKVNKDNAGERAHSTRTKQHGTGTQLVATRRGY